MACLGSRRPRQEEAGFRLQQALADRAQAPLCLRCCMAGGGLRSPLGSPPCSHPTAPPRGGWHRLQSREHGGAEEDPGRRRASLRLDLTACSLQPAPPFDSSLRESHPGAKTTPCCEHSLGTFSRACVWRTAACCRNLGGLPRPAIALASGTEVHPTVHPLSRGRAQLQLFSAGHWPLKTV